MTDFTDNEYPSNWHPGGGESSRNGYYLSLFFRVLPGSNQHVERFLELRVDTSGQPPDTHHIELNYCTEDGSEVSREERLATESIGVENPDSEALQEAAESEAQAAANELMREYADWTP